jgi:hypothetical protein
VRDAAELFRDRRALEGAKVAAERDERGVVERLVAENEDEVRMPGGGDRRDSGRVERLPEIDAADLRAERSERPEDIHFGGAGNCTNGGFGSLSGGTYAGASVPAGPRCLR